MGIHWLHAEATDAAHGKWSLKLGSLHTSSNLFTGERSFWNGVFSSAWRDAAASKRAWLLVRAFFITGGGGGSSASSANATAFLAFFPAPALPWNEVHQGGQESATRVWPGSCGSLFVCWAVMPHTCNWEGDTLPLATGGCPLAGLPLTRSAGMGTCATDCGFCGWVLCWAGIPSWLLG